MCRVGGGGLSRFVWGGGGARSLLGLWEVFGLRWDEGECSESIRVVDRGRDRREVERQRGIKRTRKKKRQKWRENEAKRERERGGREEREGGNR